MGLGGWDIGHGVGFWVLNPEDIGVAHRGLDDFVFG